MDAFQDRHPYRCLPLTMANCTGWEILCPIGITIEWDGGPMEENIKITGDEPWPPVKNVADSHFRRGIVTFHTGHLFRTEPGWSRLDDGPAERAQGRHLSAAGPGRDRMAAFPVHDELADDAPGQGPLREGRALLLHHLVQDKKLEEIQPSLRLLADNPG
jgi:hypothetical protein